MAREPDPLRPARSLALVGNPNAGKTTLFNALTGLRQKVGNYPGVTVEKRAGVLRLADDHSVEVLDLPGTYSLVTMSPDEQVVSDVLHGVRADTPRPDAILAVVDADNLARNLFLVSQIVDLDVPLVVALNMVDLAARHGHAVDAALLSEVLGCEVVPVVGNKAEGLPALVAAVRTARRPHPVQFAVPAAMAEEEQALGALIVEHGGLEEASARVAARRLLAHEPGHDLAPLRDHPTLAGAVEAARSRLAVAGIDPTEADISARYRWIDGVVDRVVTRAEGPATRSITQRVDAVALHRVWGLVLFAALMAALFLTVFWVAKPLMDGVKSAVAWLALRVAGSMAEGPLKALVIDGVFGGVGAVMVFTPQIAVLFLSLAALEDSGYLARAAFLMDRLLSRVGLHGKSFIPLLSSFACAIPGVLSTRTIDDRRDRLATILVAPFMGCSARLPIYALLVAACFPSMGPVRQAILLLGLYVAGIVAAVLTSLLVKRKLAPAKGSAFILELPSYKRPQGTHVLYQAWTNTWAFVTRAGTTICAFSIVLWALMYYPRLSPTELAQHPTEATQRAAQIEHSYAGRAGHAIEPVVRPLGYDWKMGLGLVSAYAAREVFVSTLGIAYRVGEVRDDTTDLTRAMAADRYPDGRKVWTPLVATSLMIWFVLAMQCMSTMAVVRRETGSWRWPLAQLVYMNGLAYLASLLIFQIGRRILGA